MVSCLGLYIENNLIKYAKVSKDKEGKRIEAFGVKFYEKLEDGIKQIVEETYSHKIPICVNLSEETYQYFEMFSLLSKNDLDKAIKTEFEASCAENGYNPNVFETRYAVVENLHDREKLKTIFVSDNKIELNKKLQLFDKYRLTGIFPLPIALPTLSESVIEQNSIIVNIEEYTTITTIINKQVFDIKVLEQGSSDFLDKINLKENSYAKAYEMCKETTIYTSEGKELSEDETGYLEEIMPVLYPIVGQVQKTMNESLERIENVYITGTAALINNIDLYFQEYLENVKCELLRPDFVTKTEDINIKDYIEVNSAIAIGVMGLGEGIAEMNFKKNTLTNRIKDFLKIEIKAQQNTANGKKIGFLTNDLGQPLNKSERRLLNIFVGIFILLIIYSGFSLMLKKGFDYKIKEAEESISNSNKEISTIEMHDNTIKSSTSRYTKRIENLQKINDNLDSINNTRGAIPGLLNQLMNVIPDGVKITSIENTGEKHIKIEVESAKYEQIAFLIGSIKTDVILTEVFSTSGEKTNDRITVTIEGELP